MNTVRCVSLSQYCILRNGKSLFRYSCILMFMLYRKVIKCETINIDKAVNFEYNDTQKNTYKEIINEPLTMCRSCALKH